MHIKDVGDTEYVYIVFNFSQVSRITLDSWQYNLPKFSTYRLYTVSAYKVCWNT